MVTKLGENNFLLFPPTPRGGGASGEPNVFMTHYVCS